MEVRYGSTTEVRYGSRTSVKPARTKGEWPAPATRFPSQLSVSGTHAILSALQAVQQLLKLRFAIFAGGPSGSGIRPFVRRARVMDPSPPAPAIRFPSKVSVTNMQSVAKVAPVESNSVAKVGMRRT